MGDTQIQLIRQHSKLNEDIKNTIKAQESLYSDIQKIDNEYYDNNRKKFKINEKITDLVEHRNKIWSFLNDKYNDNTRLRKNLYKRADDLIKQKEEQIKETQYLEDKLRDMQIGSDTTKRNFHEEKYQKERYEYYVDFLRIISISFTVCIIILSLAYSGFIGSSIPLLLVGLIIITVVSYTVYYVYIANLNRHHMFWNKLHHPNPKIDTSSCYNNSSSYKSDEDVEYEEKQRILEEKLTEMTKI